MRIENKKGEAYNLFSVFNFQLLNLLTIYK